MKPQGLFVTPENASLLTDLYELTMAAAYWVYKVNDPATFELYFRRLPANRSYVLAAGLEQALHYIQTLRFSSDQIAWLRSQPQFQQVPAGFFEYLRDFSFSGEVWAMPEGTPVFPLEPILRIRAPMIQAQILETYLLTIINMQSLIATKAARIVSVANGRGVIDFGARRAHGPQAALLASRAAFIGGCIGTSNVLAGVLTGMPVYGTAAHSFTMAFPTEMEAFHAYHKVFPESTVLLMDTYDVLQAARKVKEVSAQVLAVRIDSGDLAELSFQVRRILDQDGLQSVKIFVSGDMNEWKIRKLIEDRAPIDFFGVGTELVTSYDDPALGGVYKLVETTVAGRALMRVKTSPGKRSYPGAKQIYRFFNGSVYSHDLLSLSGEEPPQGATPLLQCYVRNGKLAVDLPELTAIRDRASDELRRLPTALHNIDRTEPYTVELSRKLTSTMEEAERSAKAS